MPNSKRFGGRRFKHDSAQAGIFIQGGSNVFPHTKPTDSDWWHRDCEKRGANSFHITTPTKNRRGEEIPEAASQAMYSFASHRPFPTFKTALAHAVVVRDSIPALQDCHIYACTDCVMETSCSGSFAVQLVSPSRVYRPNGMGPCPVHAHTEIREALA
jgi:hypothetical protein